MFDFKEELRKLPDNPGVYLMHNSDDKIIYVGKAKVLKNRVRQYFQNSANHTPKVKAMVSNIAWFEYIITDSETEALALECNLIKKHRPKYNILLKDDKHYPYIKITINENYPRILQVRRLQKDGAKYYGPYVCTANMRNTLDIIQKLFKPPMCRLRFPDDIKKHRPCLNYHIHNCFAPCLGNVGRDEYRKTFFDICRFLDGEHKELLRSLTDEMQSASENLEYEKAAVLRDKINAINAMGESQKVINTDHQDDSDIIAVAKSDLIVFCEVFFVRGGKVIGHENYKIENTSQSDEAEILTDFVKQFYRERDSVPAEIDTEYEIHDKDAIAEWLSTRRGKKVRITTPKRGEKAHMMKMVRENAELSLENYKIKAMKEREKNTLLDTVQKTLGLERQPSRIEAYDISNIQGTDNVGGMVVFEDGRPAKRKYRIFKIKSFEGADDYAAMSEVIYRRYRHAKEEEEKIASGEMELKDARFLPYPDLILLDGGKGHLNTISELMEMLDIDVSLFGMVKNDKHRTRGLIGSNGEIELGASSPVFKLITRIQDEVHNTAISYHRKLRSKITSELEEISGIGEKRRKSLLTKFGSVDKIKSASVNELLAAEGMNQKSAESVYNYFHKGE